MRDEESSVAAVSRVLARETGVTPSNLLAMMLIEAVRATTPPPREVTIGLLTKILRALDPSPALDAWAARAAREVVAYLAKLPEIQHVAEFVGDERLWCTLEGTIAGMLLRVCRGQDLEEPGDARV